MNTLENLRAGKLAGARHLKLACGLETFPREIFDLADTLEVLDLSGNALSSLPDDLPRLAGQREDYLLHTLQGFRAATRVGYGPAMTEALAGTKGSVVNVNSMVIRHSQPKYGAYKMAKSALLAMSQSLASELGEQGIRVNSVVPGYIWGETLQGYFAHQAGKYGTTVEAIYDATAASSDLKRLPTEDEVASAILFFASDLSSGITGQTLDVNCGEYKA